MGCRHLHVLNKILPRSKLWVCLAVSLLKILVGLTLKKCRFSSTCLVPCASNHALNHFEAQCSDLLYIFSFLSVLVFLNLIAATWRLSGLKVRNQNVITFANREVWWDIHPYILFYCCYYLILLEVDIISFSNPVWPFSSFCNPSNFCLQIGH